jgi:hypothetical protein
MNALLGPIKEAEELRAGLEDGEPGSAELYDAETQVFRYIVSDGKTVACYTVTELTLVQAATIAAACEGISEWNFKSFAAAVEVALGPVQLVQ